MFILIYTSLQKELEYIQVDQQSYNQYKYLVYYFIL